MKSEIRKRSVLFPSMICYLLHRCGFIENEVEKNNYSQRDYMLCLLEIITIFHARVPVSTNPLLVFRVKLSPIQR